MRDLKSTVFAAAVAAIVVGAGGDALALNDGGVANPGVEVFDGDKRFFNFICTSTNTITGGQAGLCADIDIVAIAGDVHGIDIANPNWVAAPGEAFDILFDFEVEVVAPSAKQISSVTLKVDSSVTGTGLVNVAEEIFEAGSNTKISDFTVFNLSGSSTEVESFDLVPPRTGLRIRKDIIFTNLDSPGTGSEVRVVLVSQEFQQIPVPVGLGLFGMGVAGLFAGRRLRRHG